MELSKRGLELIKSFEGCRLTAYQCAAGVWTIGYGHTSGVKKGDKITQDQADSFLKADCSRFVKHVNEINNKYHYGFNQNEFDALCSFCYNIGNVMQVSAPGFLAKENSLSPDSLSVTKASVVKTLSS